MEKKRDFDIESYRILAELSNAIMFEWDIAEDKIYVSANWKVVFGTEPQPDACSKNIAAIFSLHPDDPDLLTPYIWELKAEKKKVSPQRYYQKIEMRLLTKKRGYLWYQFRLLLRCDALGVPERVFCMMTDIDLQKQEYEKLLYQAQTDVLTGLYNKATIQALIKNYLESSRLQDKNQALFIIDIDGFKEVNDHFGHLFGDAVIAEIARQIRDAFRESDLVGRIGGDEFIALFKNIGDKNLILRKAEELSRQLQRTYKAEPANYNISGSIGIVLSPEYGVEFDDLFQKADQALYYVKSHGKNSFYLYHDELPLPQYVSSRAMLHEPKKKRPKAFYENVIEYIFKILYRSQDANAATNLILEIIGKKYHISRTFIIEKNPQGEYVNTFEWCDAGVASQQNEQQHIPAEVAEKFLHHFDENGVFSCVNTKFLPQDILRYFDDSPVQAFLECSMMNEGSVDGVIGFEYHEGPREWKSEEIESLSFTAEILGTFLLKKRSLDRMKLSHMQALEILDHIDSFIYVLDKNSHEILFLNKTAIEFFGTDQLGKRCYEIISGEDAPCPFCPLLSLTESIDCAQKEMYFPKTDLWVKAAVSRIQWSKDRDVCMLHCHNITALKKK